MDRVWSNSLMGIESLDTIRNLRFHKNNAQIYRYLLPLKEDQKVLDVGCGTGSLTRSLYDWLEGKVSIVGIDSDEGYIEYCKNKALENNYNIVFKTGDACMLDFSDSCFDVTVSSSVIEHVDNIPFISEQYRVLKSGGYIIVMNVAGYKETFGAMEEICPISMEESEIKKELGEYDHQNIRKPTNRFLMHRKQNHIWLKMIEECGFQNISHFVVKTSWSVDNKQDKQYAKMIIDNFFANDIGLIWNIKNNCRERAVLEKSYRLMELLNERKNKRLELFEKGIKIWDCIETDTNIFMGQK